MRRLLLSLLFPLLLLAQGGTPPGGYGPSSGSLTSAGAPANSIYASPSCPASGSPRCFQLPPTGGILWDCVFANTSNIVNCPDAVFTPSMVGMAAFGTNICATGGGCENSSVAVVPIGTITGYTDSSHVTVSAPANANCTYAGNQLCNFLWGNRAHTQLNAAWAAAASSPDCVSMSVSGGVWFFSEPIANTTTAACKLGIGVSRTGPEFSGEGPNATILVPTPDFDFAACTFGGSTIGCNFTSPGINLDNFQIFGGGVSLTGSPHNIHFVELNTTNGTTNNMVNVSFSSYGGASANFVGLDFYNTTPQPFQGVWLQGFGTINLQLNSAGASTGAEANNLFIEDCNLYCMYLTSSSTFMNTNNSVFGPGSGTNSITVRTTGGSWYSVADSVNFGGAGTATSNIALSAESGALANLTNDFIVQPSSNTGSAVSITASTVTASQSIITGGNNHAAITCNSSATAFFKDGGLNTISAPGGSGVPFFNCNPGSVIGNASITTNPTTAATNFGTAIGSTALIASTWTTNPVSIAVTTRQVTAGASCTVVSNTATVTISYTAPGSTAETVAATGNQILTISGNGAVDTGLPGSSLNTTYILPITAKINTPINYSVASALASTGCSPIPQYTVDLRLQ